MVCFVIEANHAPNMMKISRLIQPKNPLFWLLVALNLLSMALSYVAQNFPLNTLGTVLVVLTAIANAVLSAFLAWRLVNS
jgi:4-hydroxybenzoate polyprenyltransferase